MRFLLVASLKDLRRRLADPIGLILWISIPVGLGALMSLGFGRADAPPRARVLLVDEDRSPLSNLVANAAGGGQLGRFLDLQPVTLEAGRARIDAGDATALLILPKGFQQAILNEQPAELRLVTNPAQTILPGIVREGLDILIEAVFYAQQILGEPLRKMVEGPGGSDPFFSNEAVAAISTDINARLQRLGGVVFPPVITVDMVDAQPQRAGAGLNFGELFLPGQLLMALLFIAQGLSSDIWREKERGTLRRNLSGPEPLGLFLGGKVAAGAAIMAAVALAGLLLAVFAFGLSPWRVPMALVWCTLTGTALFAVFLFLQLLATSQRGGNLVATMVVFPLIMIGGSFFPFEAMPAWMAQVGRWTPNGLAVVRLKELLFGDPAAGSLALAAVGIVLPAVLLFVLSVSRLRRRFAIA